jgi:hypothetical protein
MSRCPALDLHHCCNVVSHSATDVAQLRYYQRDPSIKLLSRSAINALAGSRSHGQGQSETQNNKEANDWLRHRRQLQVTDSQTATWKTIEYDRKVYNFNTFIIANVAIYTFASGHVYLACKHQPPHSSATKTQNLLPFSFFHDYT